MYQSPQSLQTPVTSPTMMPDPRAPFVPPQSHPCHALLTELLICVIHSELSPENNYEQQD
jgi:hypothetical protein